MYWGLNKTHLAVRLDEIDEVDHFGTFTEETEKMGFMASSDVEGVEVDDGKVVETDMKSYA